MSNQHAPTYEQDARERLADLPAHLAFLRERIAALDAIALLADGIAAEEKAAENAS